MSGFARWRRSVGAAGCAGRKSCTAAPYGGETVVRPPHRSRQRSVPIPVTLASFTETAIDTATVLPPSTRILMIDADAGALSETYSDLQEYDRRPLGTRYAAALADGKPVLV